MDELTLV